MSGKLDGALLFKGVRAALLNEWDPIDISDNPNLKDEYDPYVPEVVRLVMAGGSPLDLANHLKLIEQDLGVAPPEERRSKTAAILASLIIR